MATSTLGSSPAVKTSRLEKLSWNPLTPASVPAGARISAGKSGRVAISLPAIADSAVNCIPANCMPSPESPANRITTLSRRTPGLCAALPPPSPEDSTACPAASGGRAISIPLLVRKNSPRSEITTRRESHKRYVNQLTITNGPNKGKRRSTHAEFAEFIQRFAPFDAHLLDPRRARSATSPRGQQLKRPTRPLGDHLD